MKSKLLQPIPKRPPMAETPSKPTPKKAAPKPGDLMLDNCADSGTTVPPGLHGEARPMG
jgi:hypothetical protein